MINFIKKVLIKLFPSLTSSLYDEYESFKDHSNALSKFIPRTILQFEYHLVEHCNLNCKSCSHFSPLAKPEFSDPEEFERDVKRISHLFHGECASIHLLGGEPLLHPEVTKFFDIARNYFPHARLDLVTNGLLIPKMNQNFWDSCKKNKILIRPTKYPINFDYSQVNDLCKKNGIPVNYSNNAQKIKTLFFWPLSQPCDNNSVFSFSHCAQSNDCIYLGHGKLYTCPLIPNIRHLNAHFGSDFHVSDADFIDIYKCDSAKEIFQFLASPAPFCRYCNIAKRRTGFPYKTSEKKYSEWVIEDKNE